MTTSKLTPAEGAILPAGALTSLFEVLRQDGFQPVGPTVQDGRLVLDRLAGPQDLPRGWTTQAEAGSFQLVPRADGAYFSFNLGQESWKKFFFPSSLPVFQTRRQPGGLSYRAFPDESEPLALIGVRPCELAALDVHDRVLRQGVYADPVYSRRRDSCLIVAVNCTEADAACFCASLATGPEATTGYDLVLTELIQGEDHGFLVRAGSRRGEKIVARLPRQPASPVHRKQAEKLISGAAASQSRSLPTSGLPQLLYDRHEHPHWEEVAARCLSCGNCALVCPTCFCYSLHDRVDLDEAVAERWRTWDVCHTLDHSYIHGGAIRTSTRARYRQWLTHKLAAWLDQFGCLGCTGCGRCLVWCPVGIDLTAELRALRDTPNKE